MGFDCCVSEFCEENHTRATCERVHGEVISVCKDAFPPTLDEADFENNHVMFLVHIREAGKVTTWEVSSKFRTSA